MLGILSLMVWTMLLIVTLKYVLVLLNADNKGEGGTFALMALGQSVAKRSASLILVLGVVGAAFFYGDAVITPAISVLSAVEGLKLAAPQIERISTGMQGSGVCVLPITVVILVMLFAVQSRGTAKVARYFGPITLVWFVVLAIGGLIHIIDDLRVFQALNPWLGVHFVLTHGVIGLAVMGLVFLVVTGAEALYADLGHFGRKPIQVAWLAIVQPALILNYFGQGALLLAESRSHRKPFLPALSELGPDPDGGAGDGCDRDCQPGRHHRRLLVHASGHPARIGAAPGHPAHVREHCRPDLPAARQPAPVRRRAHRYPRIPQLQRACGRLRPVRHRNHGDRQPDGVLRGVAVLELAALEGCHADGAAAADRAGLPDRQRAQDPGGRLAAPARGRAALPDGADLGARIKEPDAGDAQGRGRPANGWCASSTPSRRTACRERRYS